MKDNKEIFWSVLVGVVVVILIAGFAYFNRGNGGAKDRPGFYEGPQSLERLAEISLCPLTADKDAFAKCLTEKGLVMYGAEWCVHCKEQKALFGNSFQYVKYVECPDNTQLCVAEGINGYPTWKVKK